MGLLNAIVFIFEKFSFSSKSFFEFLEKNCEPLKTRALKLDTRFLKSLRIEIPVSSQDCQLAFDRYCRLGSSTTLEKKQEGG